MTDTRKDALVASESLIGIVEGIQGAMQHGTWRDENGMRLKDTPEWVAFYVAVNVLIAEGEGA